MKPTIEDVIAIVAADFEMTVGEIKSDCRRAMIVFPRHVAMYLSYLHTGRSMEKIARQFKRDHTSVVHAIKKFKQTREQHAELFARLEQRLNDLQGRLNERETICLGL